MDNKCADREHLKFMISARANDSLQNSGDDLKVLWK
jgi:hypothetical protein